MLLPPSSLPVFRSLRSLLSVTLVGRRSPHSPSRSDSALLRIPSGLVLGGGFCPVRRDFARTSLALSVGFAGSIPHRLPPPALPVAPLRPPLPPVALVGKSGGYASPHFWIAVFYSLAPSGRFKRAKKPLFD